ncbi:hypothetical protein I3843_01G022600 [Carya illinoinensis]|uniref:probable disease resistance protein At5g66900 n=1 Tax=Carya illinoinensis TaxID=32201 RepID=UPI001C71D780|nr:probable disease resistance protein At5g66900 [Carya illinoinensis]KAG7993775.1 hypothetical protein I3843_01G022600 [Carya illinoinensis]
MAIVESAALGAAFGRIFSSLYDAITDAITKIRMYESILQRLKDTLDVMRPLVEKMVLSNREQDLPEERTKRLIERMEKGEKRVRKYSQLPWWKYLMRIHYANKLLELEKDLGRFFKVEISASTAMNTWESVKGVNDIRERLGLTRQNSVASCAVPRLWEHVFGLDVPLQELKMQLLKEEVSMLVLTAPGGCGKTTLAKKLGDDDDIKGKFEENIFFVPVSKTPNLKVIIQKLLGKDDRSPAFQSDEDAIHQLEQMLLVLVKQNKRILLILDDVWSGSEYLLEKFAFPLTNYKILVTSRTAFPGIRSYKLKPLNDGDAMKLFRHSAGLQDGSSSYIPDASYIPDGEMVKKIVKGCGGFPLALKVVGKSLRGKSVAAWLLRVAKWSDGCSILDTDIDSELLKCLQSSLDFKDHEMILRECFMDLGSFPEDRRIRVSGLIDMWSELYELVADGIHAIANLHELNNLNLVNLVATRQDASEVGSYCSEDFVLQHDLLRELAIHQCSQEPIEKRKKLILDINGNNLPKWWTEQKQQHISSHLLSISTDENFSSSWCKIQPPEVKVLVLNFQTQNYTLPEFVEKMKELKVLIATNYGSFPVELGNFQLLGSVPSLKRIRLEKVSLPSICKTLSASRSLEKISLFMCHIGHAFRNCSIQISDALPNLREINIDYCINLVELPAGIFNIISLKNLNITNCHKLSRLPDGLGKLKNLEVLRVRSCTVLLELPESTGSLHNLVVLDISGCLRISKLPKHIGKLCNMKEFHMKGCSALHNQLPPSIMDLEHLKLVVCDKGMAKQWESIIKEFPAHHSSPQIKVVENDINLKWLHNHF